MNEIALQNDCRGPFLLPTLVSSHLCFDLGSCEIPIMSAHIVGTCLLGNKLYAVKNFQLRMGYKQAIISYFTSLVCRYLS